MLIANQPVRALDAHQNSIGANTVVWRRSLPQGQNYEQSQILIKPYRDTTASRTIEQLKKSPPPSPLRYQGTGRGVSNREGDTNISASRLSARNRFLLLLSPRFRDSSGQQHRN